jgi:hypothetical protein
METESPSTFTFGSSTYNLPSKGSGDDDDDPDERKPPSKPLPSSHTAPKKRKLTYPRLNRKGKPSIDDLLGWALGAIEALKDLGIGGDWSKLENGVTSAHQQIVHERENPTGQSDIFYKFFNGYLNQVDGHLADAGKTSSVEPSTGFGLKRADAEDDDGVLVDYKTLGEHTDQAGQSSFRSSLYNYLLTGKTIRMRFRNGIPSWTYGMAREEARKGTNVFMTTVYFNGTLIIDDGRFVGPNIGAFVVHLPVPQSSTTTTSSSSNNSAPTMPTATPPPPAPAVKRTQSLPDAKKAKTSSKSGPGQTNTMLNYFGKKKDNDKDPPGTKT